MSKGETKCRTGRGRLNEWKGGWRRAVEGSCRGGGKEKLVRRSGS